MTPYRPLLPALALALALVLGACGKAQDQAAETLAEKALEASSGQDVDIEMGDDGQTMTVKTEQGELTHRSGENVPLPADFPTDIVLPGDHAVMSVMTMGPATSVVMRSGKPISELFDQFKAGQAGEGWKETMSMQGADGSMLGFEKDGRSLLVNLGNSDDGGTTVSLSLQAR